MQTPPNPLSQSAPLAGAAATPQEAGEGPDDKLLPMLGLMFLDYDLPAYAAQLASLDDGLALPEIFTWSEPEPVEVKLRLEPEEIKTVLVFEQILQQKRKSGKYYQAIKDLAERRPAPELEMLLLTYLTQWLPNEAEQRFAAQLTAHPDWLLLRCLWCTRLLMEVQPAQMPLALVAFLERMGDKLELHQHLDAPAREALSADLVNVFYYATALFFMQTDQFERALYSLNVLARSGPRESALNLLELLLRRVDAGGQRERLQAFVAPFQAERLQALKARRNT